MSSRERIYNILKNYFRDFIILPSRKKEYQFQISLHTHTDSENICNSISFPKNIEWLYSKNTLYVSLNIGSILKQRQSSPLIFSIESPTYIIEHTSANPTGKLHIGRARNAIIGDTLIRVFKAIGISCQSEYYVNDMGRQFCLLVKSIGETLPDNYSEIYVNASNKLKDSKSLQKDLDRYVTSCDEGDPLIISKIRKFSNEILQKDVLSDLIRFNISYDNLVFESDVVIQNNENKVLLLLNRNLDIFQKEDKYIYYLHKDRKIPLTRTNGNTLYSSRDIFYNLERSKRSIHTLTILGEDTEEHEGVLLDIISKLSPKIQNTVCYYGFVRLPDGKMSTRAQNIVYLDDLLSATMKNLQKSCKDKSDEDIMGLAASCIRYSIIRIKNRKGILFDVNKSLSFKGESYIYSLYSLIRARKVLLDMPFHYEYDESSLLFENVDVKRFVFCMDEISNKMYSVHKNKEPYIICQYLENLNSQFNTLYHKYRFISSREEKEWRVLLSLYVRISQKIHHILGLVDFHNL